MLKRDVQRLFDLVRFCRATLHKDRLITDEEYTELLHERGSVDRLQKYDRMQKTINDLKSRILALECCGNCEGFEDEKLIDGCEQLVRVKHSYDRCDRWERRRRERSADECDNCMKIESDDSHALHYCVGRIAALEAELEELKAERDNLQKRYDQVNNFYKQKCRFVAELGDRFDRLDNEHEALKRKIEEFENLNANKELLDIWSALDTGDCTKKECIAARSENEALKNDAVLLAAFLKTDRGLGNMLIDGAIRRILEATKEEK